MQVVSWESDLTSEDRAAMIGENGTGRRKEGLCFWGGWGRVNISGSYLRVDAL